MTRLAALFALSVLAGCDVLDPLETDPNVANIESVTLATAPDGGERLFVRLATRFDTTDSEVTSDPTSLALDIPGEFVVTTNEGRLNDGESLTVELRRCTEACATSEAVGRGVVEPNEWAGSERSVAVGATSVALAYRKTSS